MSPTRTNDVVPELTNNNVTSGKVPQLQENVEQAKMAHYNRTHIKGLSNQEVIDGYSDWAKTYDLDLCPARYKGPSIAAEALAAYYNGEIRETVKILDVAAGTGRVGHELNLLGFKNIDALEPSKGMLKLLLDRNVYREIVEEPIGHKVVDAIPSNTYDALVISGGMGEGHIPVTAVDEMIRVVKPGGRVVIVMREEYLTTVKEYANFESHMKALQDNGFWKQVSRVIVPEYSFKNDGVVYTYEVTSTDYPK